MICEYDQLDSYARFIVKSGALRISNAQIRLTNAGGQIVTNSQLKDLFESHWVFFDNSPHKLLIGQSDTGFGIQIIRK